jgi:hypothetical protein
MKAAMKRLGLVALWLGLASCDKTVAYSYFNVNVTLDRTTIDDELLDLVSACGVLVTFDDGTTHTGDLHCVRHSLGTNLGTFQYTTSRTSGSLKFKVTMDSYWGAELAHGESATVGIAPSSTTSVDLVVSGIANAPRMPPSAGGPVDAAPPATGNDASPPAVDGALDAPAPGEDAAVDAGADASPDLAQDAPAPPPDLAPDTATDATDA